METNQPAFAAIIGHRDNTSKARVGFSCGARVSARLIDLMLRFSFNYELVLGYRVVEMGYGFR